MNAIELYEDYANKSKKERNHAIKVYLKRHKALTQEEATFLYWNFEIPLSVLGPENYFINIQRPSRKEIAYKCVDCGKDGIATVEDRETYKAIERNEYGIVCNKCNNIRKVKANNPDVLCAMPYGDYLKTDHWKNMRVTVIEHYGGVCSACGTDGHLDVHHLTYERRGDEHIGDLIPLCRTCHNKLHRLKKGECMAFFNFLKDALDNRDRNVGD